MLAFTACSQGKYNKVDGSKIYSIYFHNPKAKFQGTIIFENGSGATTQEWTDNNEFLNCAQKCGNLFMYDRSGLGKSPADLMNSYKNPITAKLVNDKLMKLLKDRSVKAPYILVGHSYASLYISYFARKYPHLVRGLIMVDPAPYNLEYTDALMAETAPFIATAKKSSSKEMFNKYSYEKSLKYNTVAAEVIYQIIGLEQTKLQIKKLPPLNNKIPIRILSANGAKEAKAVKGDWFQNQKSWLNNNPNSKIIKVDSGHFIQLEHPKFVCKQLKLISNL